MYFKMSHVTLPLWKLRGVAEDATVVLVALLGHHVDAQERHPRVLAVPRALGSNSIGSFFGLSLSLKNH